MHTNQLLRISCKSGMLILQHCESVLPFCNHELTDSVHRAFPLEIACQTAICIYIHQFVFGMLLLIILVVSDLCGEGVQLIQNPRLTHTAMGCQTDDFIFFLTLMLFLLHSAFPFLDSICCCLYLDCSTNNTEFTYFVKLSKI